MRWRAASLMFLILLLAGSGAFARPASTDLEISRRAYRDVEKLVAFGLAFPPMIDQRPLARSEFARIVAEARGAWAKEAEPDPAASDLASFSSSLTRRRAVQRILKRLTEEFRDELVDLGELEGESRPIRVHGLEEARLEGTLISSAPLLFLQNNGVGVLEAHSTPLWDYREGRHAVDGAQASLETEHRFQLGRFFSALAHPRLEGDIYRSAASGQDDVEILLQEGYGVLQAGDAALTFGRSSVVWGPGEHGGLQLTNNARPLDLVKFSTPSPLRLPWVFRHLGRWRVSLFGANLGPEEQPRYPWLTGFRLSWMPARYVEMGFGHTVMMGGEGAPHLSALDIFGEFFGFRPAGSSPTAPNKTNHIMEASLLVRIPQLNGLQFYGILANDDKRDSVKRFLRDGSSYLAGVYLPRLDRGGIADLRLEFTRMCAIAYRHSLYSKGYTLDGLFLGDDLGPDALGLSATTHLDFAGPLSLSASADWELRRGDIHTTEIEPDGTLGDIVVTQRGPHEQRYRFTVAPEIRLSKGVELVASAGYERVLNQNFQQGVSRNNWLGALTFRFDLDRRFRWPRVSKW